MKEYLFQVFPYAALLAITLVKWLIARKQMPAPVMQVLELVGSDEAREFLRQVSAMSGLTAQQRREKLVMLLVGALEGKADQELISDPLPPEGFVRLAAEYLFQREQKGRLR